MKHFAYFITKINNMLYFIRTFIIDLSVIKISRNRSTRDIATSYRLARKALKNLPYVRVVGRAHQARPPATQTVISVIIYLTRL